MRALSKVQKFYLLLGIAGAFLYAFHLIFAIVLERGLWLDGSFFFYDMLTTGGISYDWAYPRHVAHFLTQFPAWLLFRVFHVESLHLVSLVFNAALFLLPFAGIVSCWFLLGKKNRRLFVFPALGYLAFSGVSALFQISPNHVAAASYWMYFSLVVGDKVVRGPGGWIGLILLSIVCMGSYQSILMFLPLFVLGIYLFRIRGKETRLLNPWSVSVVIMGLGALYHLHWLYVVKTKDVGNYLSEISFGWGNPDATFTLIAVLLGLVMVIAGLYKKGEILGKIIIGAAIVSAFVYLRKYGMPNPNLDLSNRVYLTLGNLPLLVIAGVCALYRPFLSGKFFSAPAWVALLGTIAFSEGSAQTLKTIEWNKLRTAVKAEIQEATGVVPYNQTRFIQRLDGAAKTSSMMWTLSCTAAVLSPTRVVRYRIQQAHSYSACAEYQGKAGFFIFDIPGFSTK